jgi:hypothetical protein
MAKGLPCLAPAQEKCQITVHLAGNRTWAEASFPAPAHVRRGLAGAAGLLAADAGDAPAARTMTLRTALALTTARRALVDTVRDRAPGDDIAV